MYYLYTHSGCMFLLFNHFMQIVDIEPYRIYITDNQDVDVDCILWPYYKCQQIHSNVIYLREDGQEFIQQQADAIVSNILNTKIAVRVADCSPIVLMWKKYFAVVHAWWKWLQWWILSKTIELLQSKDEQSIKMFVWPNIKSCCYEVWSEFLEYFNDKYLSTRESKLYLDMIKIITDTAMTYWIASDDIIIDSDCTCCSGKYFSYRGGDKDKRMMIAVEKIF